MIIIPDIHGRTFWKDAVKDRENEEIIFLGDYLDPYPWENHSEKDVLSNFIEIIEFKKSHMNNVTLLLGNHDLGPYVSNMMTGCRTLFNVEAARTLFKFNRDLFTIGVYKIINNVNYSFTHSVILKRWSEEPVVRKYFSKDTLPEIIDGLNELYKNNDPVLYKILNWVSWTRGGDRDCGSPVWADIRETGVAQEFNGWYQIFGHSQQMVAPVITPNWACLDCRRAFEITEDDEIVPITEEDNLQLK